MASFRLASPNLYREALSDGKGLSDEQNPAIDEQDLALFRKDSRRSSVHRNGRDTPKDTPASDYGLQTIRWGRPPPLSGPSRFLSSAHSACSREKANLPSVHLNSSFSSS